jgi:hypothetical protein
MFIHKKEKNYEKIETFNGTYWTYNYDHEVFQLMIMASQTMAILTTKITMATGKLY